MINWRGTAQIASCRNEEILEPLPRQADPTEHSWRGVLRGHVPSKSLSADSEIPRAHTSGHTEKVGEKSDSFSRAERTRPLRPVSRLQSRYFENVPVERFQRILPLLKLADTARRVPTKDWFILSWISLTSSTILNRSASARCDLCRTPPVVPVERFQRGSLWHKPTDTARRVPTRTMRKNRMAGITLPSGFHHLTAQFLRRLLFLPWVLLAINTYRPCRLLPELLLPVLPSECLQRRSRWSEP